MKNKHSKQDEPDMISVFIGTWNMGQARAGAGAGERGGPTPGPDPRPSPSRKCAASEKRDVLVHLEGSGEDPG